MYQLRQSTLYNHVAPPEIFIYTIIKIDFNDFCKPPHTNHTLSYNYVKWLIAMQWHEQEEGPDGKREMSSTSYPAQDCDMKYTLVKQNEP